MKAGQEGVARISTRVCYMRTSSDERCSFRLRRNLSLFRRALGIALRELPPLARLSSEKQMENADETEIHRSIAHTIRTREMPSF